jgi:hypothetical protein
MQTDVFVLKIICIISQIWLSNDKHIISINIFVIYY